MKLNSLQFTVYSLQSTFYDLQSPPLPIDCVQVVSRGRHEEIHLNVLVLQVQLILEGDDVIGNVVLPVH